MRRRRDWDPGTKVRSVPGGTGSRSATSGASRPPTGKVGPDDERREVRGPRAPAGAGGAEDVARRVGSTPRVDPSAAMAVPQRWEGEASHLGARSLPTSDGLRPRELPA